MRKIFYIIVTILIFSALAIGVFFTSEFFANKWESERLLKVNLKDTSGNSWNLSSLKERIGIIYFGYTYCPDVCPTALNDLSIALKMMGSDRHLYQPIFISVDPNRDSKQIIKEYISHFDKHFLGLTGSSAQLKSFTFNMGSTYSFQKKSSTDQNYVVNHTVGYFLVTSTGQKLPVPIRKTPEDLREVIIRIAKRLRNSSFD